jgi:hypothetical protein
MHCNDRNLPAAGVAGETATHVSGGGSVAGSDQDAVRLKEAGSYQTADAIFERGGLAGPGHAQDNGWALLMVDDGLLGRRKRSWRHFSSISDVAMCALGHSRSSMVLANTVHAAALCVKAANAAALDARS